MLNRDAARLMIEYHQSRNQKLWDAIEALGDASFGIDAAYSLGNIRNHMVHLGLVDGAWLNGLHGNPRESFVWPDFAQYAALYPTIASAKAFHDDISAQLRASVDAWSDADLLVVPAGMNEQRWQVLMHLMTHGVDHRAQVLRLIHDCGGKTFPQDLIIYLRENAKK
ncbi:MAG: hypothetical protein RLY87_2498 [Chloroflexota bacterium]|jgi:uncharacterized damage-inducible protein DinB